jgi:purine-binding chemotaxis protein CheW
VAGVINLRGTVVPVVDLRVAFGMERREYDPFTVTIVLSVADRLLGLIVDAVSDVLDLAEHDHSDTPEACLSGDEDFLSGIAKNAESLVLLLDMGKVAHLAAGTSISLEDVDAAAAAD